MKSKIIKAMTFILMSISITGCSKADYQKDESYETDVVGIYEISAKTELDNEITYCKQYTLNSNNTYNYESNVFGTSVKSSGEYAVYNETSNIIRIDFDITNYSSDNEESVNINSAKQYKTVFKYKNMFGSIDEAKDFPTSKTFNYIIPFKTGGGMVYTKDGYCHACIEINNCQCDNAKEMKYIRKDNVIYVNIKDSVSDDYWQIGGYVVDEYLFTPELYKYNNNILR